MLVALLLFASQPAHAVEPVPPRVVEMDRAVPGARAWIPGTGKLAFLGAARQGEASHLFVWDPAAPADKALTRATAYAAMRHSLAVAPDGRVAFVERDMPPPLPAPPSLDMVEPSPWRPGPETLLVADAKSGARPLLREGWVLPGSLAWSPDGARLAFVTLDRQGKQRLAVVEPPEGKPRLPALGGTPTIQGLVGWPTPHDVMLRLRPRMAEIHDLLVVGKDGVKPAGGAIDPRLSPDGRHLLDRPPGRRTGLLLRTFGGGSIAVDSRAGAYAWGPKGDRVYFSVGRDVLEADVKGKVTRRWNKVVTLGASELLPSPEGRWLALEADFGLSALELE